MSPEARMEMTDKPLEFSELIDILREAIELQQRLNGRNEADYDYQNDAMPIYRLFHNYALEWMPPTGQRIAIPEDIGGSFQVQQAEYHNEYSWIYPIPPRAGAVTSAEMITADLDGVCAYDGDKRVVLYSPNDPFHSDLEVLSRLSLVEIQTPP